MRPRFDARVSSNTTVFMEKLINKQTYGSIVAIANKINKQLYKIHLTSEYLLLRAIMIMKYVNFA